MAVVNNPILKGFNPDPSIIRVGDDYYIATSTFEWFPGVQIHHSKDLKNWQLIARPLNRLSQLDMKGNPDSCGVWAPCLSYDQGIFYLVYSNVRSFDGTWKDTPNYLVTTEDIRGAWSDPVFLNSSGFDASMYHDEDGRKWVTNMITDHRKNLFFGGIILQEYDAKQQKLKGPISSIFKGTDLGCTEAPHIYKRNGYYYLILAEGGTEYGHAVTMCRSKSIEGPYELHPNNPIFTAKDNPNHSLQKSGHADIVESANGDWYIVYLVGRPLSPKGRCTLGRETAIEQVQWADDDWLYPLTNSKLTRPKIAVPFKEHAFQKEEARDDFDAKELNISFQSLRVPITSDWANLGLRSGYMRLFGRESLSSLHKQSLLGRRVQHFNIEASLALEYSPTNFQQMAGLVCYYNTGHFYYLYKSSDFTGKENYLNIVACDNFKTSEPLAEPITLPINSNKVFLKLNFNKKALNFFYSLDEQNWNPIGPSLDGSILSDDYIQDAQNRYRPAFTGSFVGMCCQDLSGQNLHADFDWFEYKELEN